MLFLIYAKFSITFNLTSKGTNIALKYQRVNSKELNLEFLVKMDRFEVIQFSKAQIGEFREAYNLSRFDFKKS